MTDKADNQIFTELMQKLAEIETRIDNLDIDIKNIQSVLKNLYYNIQSKGF